jgi:hypothetical protein
MAVPAPLIKAPAALRSAPIAARCLRDTDPAPARKMAWYFKKFRLPNV